MELFRTEDYYVLLNKESSLWISRKTGEFEAKPGWELANSGDPECLGVFYGFVGKIDLQCGGECRLMLIKEAAPVGELPGGWTVHKITSIALINPFGAECDLGLNVCRKHRGCGLMGRTNQGLFEMGQKTSLAKTWGSIKSATSSIRNTTQHAATLATSQVKGSRRELKDRERYERRILDELHRIFSETDSFYFCCGGGTGGDLTNTLQRQCSQLQTVDDRFFWNKHMLQDVIRLNNSFSVCWVMPIIQGFVQIEECLVEVGSDPVGSLAAAPKYEKFTLSLISRRSRHRAGTRYKRRGLDEEGRCANYVETEQIVSHRHHQVSFVQVRGSVPLFWSQPGYKYRPPPRIDKGEAETTAAFARHFATELAVYGTPVCIVNLVDQMGKEKLIRDAYTQHILIYNSPQLTYASFDFHEYCRGMHFENVALLVSSLSDVLHEMGFCWKDKQGLICCQQGVFRVNCMDCLDRTNVVQTAVGKAVLEVQLTKLGLITPEGTLPLSLRTTFQQLWANNGDTISKQYAGTNALKGDYTRTGERKLTGMMKDGMNSANRYLRAHLADDIRQAAVDLIQGVAVALTPSTPLNRLVSVLSLPHPLLSQPMLDYFVVGYALYRIARYYLSRFKDAYRQATIDLMLGNPVSEEVFSQEKEIEEGEDVSEAMASAEHVKQLIEDLKKMLISESSIVLGAWGLIDADPQTGDPSETDMDTILILTRDSYYVADYDEHIDRVTKYQRVSLADLTLVELGPLQASSHSALQIFQKAGRGKEPPYCLRLSYRLERSIHRHTFRSTNLRFFNNVAVIIKTKEEMIESLRAISETLCVAVEVAGVVGVVWHVGDTPLSRQAANTDWHDAASQLHSLPVESVKMTRNVSETQLVALRGVGSKALCNVSQQFSKLNRLGQSFNTGRTKLPMSTHATSTAGDNSAAQCSDGLEPRVSSGDDDDDVVCVIDYRGIKSKYSDTFLPNVGIVMSNTAIKTAEVGKKSDVNVPSIVNVSLARIVQHDVPRKRPFTHSSTHPEIDSTQLKQDMAKSTPEITVQMTDETRLEPPKTLQIVSMNNRKGYCEELERTRKFSHSSGEVDLNDETESRRLGGEGERSNSERDLNLGITASQSENALRSLKSGFSSAASTVLMSPSAVLTPFSKLARGVQNLSANLDPRRLKDRTNKTPVASEHMLLENKKLQETWQATACKTRLITV